MKSGRFESFVGLGVTLAVLAAGQMNAHAGAPDGKELDAAISAGDFGGYQADISAWLSQKVPADTNRISAAALKEILKDPVVNSVLCRRQLISKYGVANLNAFAKTDQDSKAFISWLLHNTTATELYLEASTPTGLRAREEGNWTPRAGSLETWKKIYLADPDSRDGMYLKLAIGAAIGPPGSNTSGAGGQKERSDALTRYTYFKKAHKNKELLPSFDELNAWEYSKVVSSHASEEDLTWGREMINSFRPDLRDGEKVVQIVSSVWRRGSPVPYSNMATVLQGGGKCGPRSSFGVFINQAFGIPAIGVGQPGHACVAWRDPNGVWQVGYGRGWVVSKLEGLSGPDFVAGSEARSHATQFSLVEHLRWLAAAMGSHGQTSAVVNVARKMAQETPPAKANPGVAAAAGKPAANKAAVETGPFKQVNGVIHVEAGSFSKTEGSGMFSYQPGVMLTDSPYGGKQVYFAQQMNSCVAEYDIDAPEAGKYEITMKAAAINDGQILQVGSDAFNAVVYVRIPMSHGLWQATKPVDVKLVEGLQKLQISTVPGQRGVALRSFELRPKGQ